MKTTIQTTQPATQSETFSFGEMLRNPGIYSLEKSCDHARSHPELRFVATIHQEVFLVNQELVNFYTAGSMWKSDRFVKVPNAKIVVTFE